MIFHKQRLKSLYSFLFDQRKHDLGLHRKNGSNFVSKDFVYASSEFPQENFPLELNFKHSSLLLILPSYNLEDFRKGLKVSHNLDVTPKNLSFVKMLLDSNELINDFNSPCPEFIPFLKFNLKIVSKLSVLNLDVGFSRDQFFLSSVIPLEPLRIFCKVVSKTLLFVLNNLVHSGRSFLE